eukprot:TRINITY_DN6383_c0_g1_i2.p1 TRINITY_DN6383_c0_g1~~TRINITY_DN6383_c0_g1_i2.p1  ORF type:complete len:158 (-),score=18.18 TRINITY_DN6383_c0_g1_i2:29-502(-)
MIYGHKKIPEILSKSTKIRKFLPKTFFQLACASGYAEGVVQFINEKELEINYIKIVDGFPWACLGAQEKMIDFLTQNNSGIFPEVGFLNICASGNYELIQKYTNNHSKEGGLIGACLAGNLPLALGFIKEGARFEQALAWSCRTGRVNLISTLPFQP